MTSTMRMIYSSVAWAVLAAPALAHPGHGDAIGHTHHENFNSLGVPVAVVVSILGLFIAMWLGRHTMGRFVRS